MKKTHYVTLKPQHYFNQLFIFLIVVSCSLTLALVGFNIDSIDVLLLKFVVIFFILLGIATLVEFSYKGEYIGPLELYDVEQFTYKFLSQVSSKQKTVHSHFSRYDSKSRKRLNSILNLKTNYVVSSIRKTSKVYEVVLVNQKEAFKYFLVKFLVQKGILKLCIQKNKQNKFKIISLH